MAGTEDIAALRTLADVVEPVKDYARFESVKGNMGFQKAIEPARRRRESGERDGKALSIFGAEISSSWISGSRCGGSNAGAAYNVA
jgi:hypothetical protein